MGLGVGIENLFVEFSFPFFENYVKVLLFLYIVFMTKPNSSPSCNCREDQKNVDDSEKDEKVLLAEKLENFYASLQAELEQFGFNGFFYGLQEVVDVARAGEQSDIDLETEEDLYNDFIEDLRSEAVNMLHPDYAKDFIEKIHSAASEKDSSIGKIICEWLFVEKVSNAVDRHWDAIKKFEDRTNKLPLHPLIAMKIKRVLDALHKIVLTPFPARLFVAYYLEDVVKEKIEEARNSFRYLLSGTLTNSKILRSVKILSPQYAEKKVSANSEQTNLEHIASSLMRRNREGGLDIVSVRMKENILRGIDVISEAIEGRGALMDDECITDVPTEGMDEFIESTGLPPAFKELVQNVLRPILGRRDIVSSLKMHSDVSPLNRLGDYLNGVMRLYKNPDYDDDNTDKFNSEYFVTLFHEIGHALQVEKLLPLKDAMAFSVSIKLSLSKFSGPMTGYSRNAKSLYAQRIGGIHKMVDDLLQMGVSRDVIEPGDDRDWDFIQKADIDEEWAELFAYSILGSKLMIHECPEKLAISETTLKNYGIDLNDLSQQITNLIGFEFKSAKSES